MGEFFDEMERIEEQYDDRRRSFARFLGLPEEEAVQYRKPKDETPREGLADLDERQRVTKVRFCKSIKSLIRSFADHSQRIF